MENQRKKIGGRIREIRETLGMSQEALGQILGRGKGAIHKYEQGLSDPETSALAKIAEKGNVSLDWLITGRNGERVSALPQTPEEFILIKRDFFRAIIEEVEQGVKETGIYLSPEKRGELILMLCDMYGCEKPIDKATVLKLIKLAA